MAIETEKINGYTVTVDYDEGAENPRAWDNVTHLLMRDRRRNVPWECDETFEDSYHEYTLDEIVVALKRRHDAAFVFTIRAYEHSGIAYSIDGGYPFNDPWDSGTAGLAYVTNKDLADNGTLPEDARKRAQEWVQADLETYTAWANGWVYYYSIEDPNGDVVDSCAGFYDDDAMDEARRVAETLPAVEATCNGKLNRLTGEIDHTSHCPLHDEEGVAGMNEPITVATLRALLELYPDNAVVQATFRDGGTTTIDNVVGVGPNGSTVQFYVQGWDMSEIQQRLEYLRQELRAERMSWGELAELQGLADHIDSGDVELLEAAGVPEFPDDDNAADNPGQTRESNPGVGGSYRISDKRSCE